MLKYRIKENYVSFDNDNREYINLSNTYTLLMSRKAAVNRHPLPFALRNKVDKIYIASAVLLPFLNPN